MEILTRLRAFIEGLDDQRFYAYVGIFLGGCIVCVACIMFFSFRVINRIKQELVNLNNNREEIRLLLEQAQPVAQQRAEVIAMLKKENFKIGEYFQTILDQLGLSNKKKMETITSHEREGDYRETELRAEFVDLTMKNIVDLLQEIAQNPRLYTKELDISRSRRGDTLDAVIIFATLHSKNELPAELIGQAS